VCGFFSHFLFFELFDKWPALPELCFLVKRNSLSKKSLSLFLSMYSAAAAHSVEMKKPATLLPPPQLILPLGENNRQEPGNEIQTIGATNVAIFLGRLLYGTPALNMISVLVYVFLIASYTTWLFVIV
jgi:hypothetical protein